MSKYKPNVDLSTVLTNTVLPVYQKKFRCEKRYDIYYGGAGSGKSRFVAQKIMYRMIYQKGHRFLVVRKTKESIKASVFQLLRDYIEGWGIESLFHITESPMKITHLLTGNTILFYGIDNPEKLKSIEKITTIWIEEASELDECDFNELDRRLRGKMPHYKQIMMTFNPISHLHWLKKRFFDITVKNCDIIKTTYLDNPELPEEDRQVLLDMKQYDLQQYLIYAMGEWGVLSTNVVYHNFKPKKHTTQLTVSDFQNLHIGLDFNIGGCVGVVAGLRDTEVHIVDTFVVYDTDAIVTQLMTYQNKNITLYPDSSGKNRSSNSSQSDLEILRDAGYYCDVPKSNPPIRNRVNSVNRMFATDRLFVNDRLEELDYALETQTYTPKGEPEKFTTHPSIDDYNDGLGYFINQRFGLIKSGIHSVRVERR